MPKNLVHKNEQKYFLLAATISVLIYVSLAISIVGLFIVLGFTALSLFLHALMIGSIRTNAVKLNERQFPEVYEKAKIFLAILLQEIGKETSLPLFLMFYISSLFLLFGLDIQLGKNRRYSHCESKRRKVRFRSDAVTYCYRFYHLCDHFRYRLFSKHDYGCSARR